MKKATTFATITIIVSALIVGCLVSCTPTKQNQRKHKKIEKAKSLLREYLLLDDICAEEFPVKEEYIKGDTVVHFDTLYVDGIIYDTVTLNDTVYITRSLPGKIINRTFTITDTIVKENTALKAMLQQQIEALKIDKVVLETKLDAVTTERNEWRRKARKFKWLLIAAVSLFVGWQFRGRLFPLISKLFKK